MKFRQNCKLHLCIFHFYKEVCRKREAFHSIEEVFAVFCAFFLETLNFDTFLKNVFLTKKAQLSQISNSKSEAMFCTFSQRNLQANIRLVML